jgi:predicted dehydrogenase
MKKIKWGIVSTGNIANSFAKDFKYVHTGELHAVASRSKEKADKFAGKYSIPKSYGSYKQLYEDKELDAIYVATPHNFHFNNASDALSAGKAVLCEKPITINTAECRQLIEIAKSTGNYLMEAMWTYFLPPILQAQKWIMEGRIGDVKYIKADFGFKGDIEIEPRLYDPEYAGGALLDIGIYPIALARLIYKKSPEKISVFSKKTDTDVDSEETMIFEYSNGGIANLTASILYEMPNEAIIIGDKGYISIPDFFVAKECFLYKNEELPDHFIDRRESVGYNYEIEAVNQDLRNGKPQSDIVPLSTSMQLQELMALVKSKF